MTVKIRGENPRDVTDSILEIWVPAEEFEQFKDHIVGEIEVVREFR